MRKRSVLIMAIVSSIMSLTFAGSVTAQMRARAVSLFPFAGGYVFDDKQGIDNELAVGIGVGYNLNERWGLEGSFIGVKTRSAVTGEDVNAYLYRLEGLYHFDIAGRFVPFLAAGLGGITLIPEVGDAKNNSLLNYGGGIKLFLGEDVALRGEVRHVMSFGSTQHNFIYTVGLSIFFGGEMRARMPEAASGPMRNFIPEPYTAPPPTRADSDGDGVYDDQDECPGTPAGARVDARGCWALRAVLFDFDKSVIKPEGRPFLDEVVIVLQNNPFVRIDIEGHTDNIGSIQYNQGLSERRAGAVMEYFVSLGIAPMRLTAQGFGESRPIAGNRTKEGRALNRRVELKPLR